MEIWSLENMKYVIAHANCFDGSAAAYAAWRKFEDNATYLYCQYGDDMPELPDGAEVWFLDFFQIRWIDALLAQGCDIHVLDHHESAVVDTLHWIGNRILRGGSMEYGWANLRDDKVFDLRGSGALFGNMESDQIEDWIDLTAFTALFFKAERLDIKFSLSHSGAEMAWMNFFGASRQPDLISYVGDRDRWVWQLPNSEAVSEGLWDSLKRFRTDRQAIQGSISRFTEVALDDVLDPQADAIAEFQFLNHLAHNPDYCKNMVAIGLPLVTARQAVVQQLCQDVRFCTILGYKVPTVRANCYHSWVGHYLLDRYPAAPFAAVVRDQGAGVMGIELRSRPGFRVNRIARQLGGGGHPTAAGFRLQQVRKLKIGDRFCAAVEMNLGDGIPIQINIDPDFGYRWQIQPDASVQRIDRPADVIHSCGRAWVIKEES
jgi:hypothetical protein